MLGFEVSLPVMVLSTQLKLDPNSSFSFSSSRIIGMSSRAHVLFSYCQGSSMTCYPWPIAYTVALQTTSERAPGQRQAGDHPMGGDEAGPLVSPVEKRCKGAGGALSESPPLAATTFMAPESSCLRGRKNRLCELNRTSLPPSSPAGSLAF